MRIHADLGRVYIGAFDANSNYTRPRPYIYIDEDGFEIIENDYDY